MWIFSLTGQNKAFTQEVLLTGFDNLPNAQQTHYLTGNSCIKGGHAPGFSSVIGVALRYNNDDLVNVLKARLQVLLPKRSFRFDGRHTGLLINAASCGDLKRAKYFWDNLDKSAKRSLGEKAVRIFTVAFESNQLEFAKWFYSVMIFSHPDQHNMLRGNNFSHFVRVIESGHTEITQWYFSLANEDRSLQSDMLKAREFCAFRYAVIFGHHSIADYLYAQAKAHFNSLHIEMLKSVLSCARKLEYVQKYISYVNGDLSLQSEILSKAINNMIADPRSGKLETLLEFINTDKLLINEVIRSTDVLDACEIATDSHVAKRKQGKLIEWLWQHSPQPLRQALLDKRIIDDDALQELMRKYPTDTLDSETAPVDSSSLSVSVLDMTPSALRM